MATNLLQIQNAFKSYGSRNLFTDAAFAVNEGEHVGVIGPNGAGKTTLFKIILGEDNFDRGEIVRSRGLRIGYLAQHDDWTLDETVEHYVAKGAVSPVWELRALGRGLGLSDDTFEKKMGSLSGGYRMRAKLLALLGQNPDLMMLDEPTNYLDLDSLLVLENFLQDFKGAFLLISHDREFLRRTTDHILEVEQGEITKFNGNLDDYFEQKEMLRAQLEARAMGLAQKRKEILDFVARFGAKATKARQAQSRLKSLGRMETIEIKALPVKARIKIPEPTHCGKDVLKVVNADIGYPSKTVLSQVNFEIRNGDHLGVVGVNGAGKTTFLRALAGDLAPLKGEVQRGYQVSLGYYAQHVAESLRSEDTVLQAMGEWAHPQVGTQDIKDMAGSLLFSGTDIEKKVAILSGGERSRVALGRILLKRAPCLILDEPTNHLDFQTVEALTDALKRYEGTVVVVSHDRSFVRRVSTKILEIRSGSANLYSGSYDDYVWSLSQGVLAKRLDKESVQQSTLTEKLATDIQSTPSSAEQRKQLQKEQHKLQKESDSLERTLEDVEKRLESANHVLACSESPNERQAMVQELAALTAKKTEMEDRWMIIIDRLSEIKKQLG